jgi:pyruvate/2-oxoglutarate dehydrogenase complex dihydrolipoamide dehydrogenase (E3) component
MAFDYDLIVIGGGAAGLSGSGMGVVLGAKTMMVEADRLGGDCTWTGCVPSKAILKGAKVAHALRHASTYGLVDQPVEIGFERLLAYVRQVRENVYEEADRPEIYENLGITVSLGTARFVDDHTISIEKAGTASTVTSRYFLIGTGAKAFVPPIPGLDGIPYLTNETLFELTERPPRLVVVGGGPIGSEMAQAFARLGSTVTIVDMVDRILPRDDAEASSYVAESLQADGVQLELGAGVKKFERRGNTTVVTIERDGRSSEIETDSVLIATGRRANHESLNLEAAGVITSKAGIDVNERCRTNRKHIYASGDVTGRYQFTHMSEHMSKVAITNMLAKFPMKIDKANVPWVTFTDPELGHVGKTVGELENAGTRFRTYRFPYSKVDRAITDSEARGLIKLYARERDGRLYGADVVGPSAGELISEYAVAMRNGVTLRKLADTIHPYPTYSLGARRAADQWYVQKYSPRLVKLLQTIFRYRGPILDIGPDDIV